MRFANLYGARQDRINAAAIIRHCKFDRKCDPINGGIANLRGDRSLYRAAMMLERRGFGVVFQSAMAHTGDLSFRLA